MLNSLPPNLMNWLEDKAVLVVLELMLSVSDERLRALSLSLVGKRWAAKRSSEALRPS